MNETNVLLSTLNIISSFSSDVLSAHINTDARLVDIVL